MKLTVVGGGSTYTPELIDGIAWRRTSLAVDEIALVDPDASRLEVVGAFSRRLLAHAGHPARVTTTADLERGADGAAAVLLQLRVGGQAARASDETFPLVCDCVGQETTGAGGLAKALRTVPVVLDIAERVRAVAGDAWIVNFTNPVGIVTRALSRAGHRAVGLCNVAIGFRRWTAGVLGVSPRDVRLGHVGLNHLTWETEVLVDGVDRLPELLGRHGDALGEHIGLPASLMRRLGMVPSYYLKYFYDHDEVVREQRTEPPRAEVVAAVERELLDLYGDESVVTKPAQLNQRGGAYYSEAAVQLVHSLTGGADGDGDGSAEQHVVNVRNDGTLPFLPDDAVVEVPAVVTDRGASPVAVAPVPPSISGLISHVTSYEHLALDAAVLGGRDRVADALLAHPLIGQFPTAERLADELVARNADFLPWARGRA